MLTLAILTGHRMSTSENRSLSVAVLISHGSQVRSMISDFAVFLTIVLMVLLDYIIGVPSQKLKVPSKFQVKRQNTCF